MKKTMRMNTTLPPMPDALAIKFLPYVALKLMYGAKVHKAYSGRDDLVMVFFDGKEEILHLKDYELAAECAKKTWKKCISQQVSKSTANTLPAMMTLHREASEYIAARYGHDIRKRALFLLSDQYGCGYWRMILPASTMKSDSWHIDVTPSEVVYDYLCTYDTVMLQRVCNWPSYYVVQRLQEAGVRVVYDLDDDMWDLPAFHPAYRKFGVDEKAAASAIIRQVDAVTTTTQTMGEAIVRHCGDSVADKLTIIPNAINVADFPVRKVYPVDATEPAPFRILWAGSATHERDFGMCLEALDTFMTQHQDDQNIRVMFMGFLPRCIAELLLQKQWSGRVEHVEFTNIETYFDMLCRVKADVAIAPLAPCPFNACKSDIKWVEYTLAGIPVIASDFGPYAASIKDGATGLLADSTDRWLKDLNDKYHNRTAVSWQGMASMARGVIEAGAHNITNTVQAWESILCG